MTDKLINTIIYSFSILELKEGWDGEDALAISVPTFHKAMIFIHLLASSVEKLIPPMINPGRDGSVDFKFNNYKMGHRLLVNVKLASASCFGYDGTDKNGDVIKTNDVKMQDIINWCNDFMTTKNNINE